MYTQHTWKGEVLIWWSAGLTLGLRPANERRRYKVTPSLIGCMGANLEWALPLYDNIGIYGFKAAVGLVSFNVGLVKLCQRAWLSHGVSLAPGTRFSQNQWAGITTDPDQMVCMPFGRIPQRLWMSMSLGHAEILFLSLRLFHKILGHGVWI